MNLRQLRALALRLAGMFGKEARDREMAEELESHLKMHIAENATASAHQAWRLDPDGRRIPQTKGVMSMIVTCVRTSE